MNFLDATFLFAFLPLTLAAFALARRFAGPGGALAVTGAASVVFAIPFGWGFMTLALGSALVNYLIGRAITARASGGLGLLVGGLVFNLGLLIVFKYGPIFSWIPGAGAQFRLLAQLVPITISFLTFQRIVLILDAYQRQPDAVALFRGAHEARGRSGLAYFAFVMGFPNLVIGPIAYASEVAPRLLARTFGRIQRSDIEVGLFLLTVGLVKKLLIADPLGMNFVDRIFEEVGYGHPVLAVEVAVAMVAYYAQLYFDFSGYSDMALGVARMLGLRLPINFNSPLRATGIVDFYRRWHITLTRIVARFMFQPLSIIGTRFAAEHNLGRLSGRIVSAWIPLLINFEMIGLWHGAAWTFVVFGLIHGTWFIIETEVRRSKAWKRWAKSTSDQLRLRLGQAITIIPLMLTFSLFRSRDLPQFLRLFHYLSQDWLAFFDHSTSRQILKEKYPLLVLAFAIIWLLPNAYEMLARYRPGHITFPVPSQTPAAARFRWRPTLVWGVLTAVAGLAAVRALGTPAPFVYGGF
jgi:D-alanyl-lipoteichoic acid acyltransferase DltB (MBOAT superfamily)